MFLRIVRHSNETWQLSCNVVKEKQLLSSHIDERGSHYISFRAYNYNYFQRSLYRVFIGIEKPYAILPLKSQWWNFYNRKNTKNMEGEKVDSRYIKLLVGFIITMNCTYLLLKLYKNNFTSPWGTNQRITEESFNKLNLLNNTASLIEVTLILLFIAVAYWLIKTKSKDINIFIFVNMVICIFFFLVGSLTEFVTDIGQFNLVQQLYGPVFVLVFLIIYQIIEWIS